MKLIATQFLVFFSLTVSFTQVTMDTAVIDQIAKLRTIALEHSPSLIDLQTLTNKWNQKQINNDALFKAVFSIISLKDHFNFDSEYILKKTIKRYPSIEIEKLIAKSDIQTIYDNNEILYLIFEGVLSLKYPYSLNRNSKILDEIKFYDLAQTDKVAHMEGYQSMVPLIMCIVHKGLNLSVNEYITELINHSKTHLEEMGSYVNTDNIITENWDLKQVQLREYDYDKIIIRNSFHHYKSRKSKLKSIHTTLKKDGELILLEPVATSTNKNIVCGKSLKLKKIISSIEGESFQLIEQMQIKDNFYLLKFKKI